MQLVAGDRIGPYEIVGSLGAGGMGKVYRARDTQLDRDVAIKIVPNSPPATSTCGNASSARLARSPSSR
jgi:serine/threonine protein kinase